MPNIKLTFGEILGRIISDQGLSKMAASKLIGKSDPAVHRLINNASSPSIDTSLKTLEPFGYTLAVIKKDASLPEGSCLFKEKD